MRIEKLGKSDLSSSFPPLKKHKRLNNALWRNYDFVQSPALKPDPG